MATSKKDTTEQVGFVSVPSLFQIQHRHKCGTMKPSSISIAMIHEAEISKQVLRIKLIPGFSSSSGPKPDEVIKTAHLVGFAKQNEVVNAKTGNTKQKQAASETRVMSSTKKSAIISSTSNPFAMTTASTLATPFLRVVSLLPDMPDLNLAGLFGPINTLLSFLAILYAMLVTKFIRRARFVKGLAKYNEESGHSKDGVIQPKIAEFYNKRSRMWENVWGEHMHHGYYGLDKKAQKRMDPLEAQIVMMREVLKFGRVESLPGVHQPKILDIGCGVGGASRYLATQFPGSYVVGVTLSKYQVDRGNELNQNRSLDKRVRLVQADCMNLPFDDGSFDLVWSLEAAEHFPDKLQYLKEAYRVLKPGGKLVMAAWCHRAAPPSLDMNEKYTLSQIYHKYEIPYMVSLEEFKNCAFTAGFKKVQTADWSEAVKPFWKDVVRSALTVKGMRELWSVGWPAFESALAMRHMQEGFERKTIVFGALTGVKKSVT